MLPRCPPAMVEPGWLLSPPGRPFLASILHKNQRRVFGETPQRPQTPHVIPKPPPKPHLPLFPPPPPFLPPPQGCWSAPRCPPPSVSPRPPTNSSCRDAAVWAKRRWWQRCLGAPRPLRTARRWVRRGGGGGAVGTWGDRCRGVGGTEGTWGLWGARVNGIIGTREGDVGFMGCSV